jgi:deoxyribodipyrimidine photo-lyase
VETAIVLFTRDLRVHDNPALHTACTRARQVVPMFVIDPAITSPPNRLSFLSQALADLRESLRARGADLVIRKGDPAAEAITMATDLHADAIMIAGDVSHYATRRRQNLERECQAHRLDLTVTPGLTVVPPGELTPAGGGHYRVFTPYWRAWCATTCRKRCPPPPAIDMPQVRHLGQLPAQAPGSSRYLARGGEQAGRQRFERWRQHHLAGYGEHHDDLAGDETSRLSAYLRFGCISPLELAAGALDRPGGEEFCRQLAWRDFFYQVTAAFPDLARRNYRPGGSVREDHDALEAWRAGQTGIPIVDAGMRQLAAEGFMHNRARMIVARLGYRHFGGLLADGDVACNAGNWQWVAGTGNNSRPNRVMNPLRQAQRFDRAGEYVRRYVPELAGLDSTYLQTPWKLNPGHRRQLGYPDPIIELS